MQNFINKINQISGIVTDSSLTPAQIIRCQKQLKQNNIAPVPDEYLQLLRFSNGLRGNGSPEFIPKIRSFLICCGLTSGSATRFAAI